MRLLGLGVGEGEFGDVGWLHDYPFNNKKNNIVQADSWMGRIGIE
jgi:hypothetical protein